ncbi:ubiquitin-conjugating enzyme E2 Z-like [Rhipicephalus microplus]|uniref:ubiquitin-conjugating enzyme E2 Z-like n=1 Tax=Rhipicephalus microplus TaxID=6941 RepID=UPI003F6D4C28
MDEPRRSAATCNLETALAQPKQPSGQCLLRLNHDFNNIVGNPVPGIFVEPKKGNVTYVHAVIVGPDNTPCQGGLLHFVLKFPLDNPACPPQMTLKTVVVSIQSFLIEQPLANERALGREFETRLEKTIGCNAKLCSQTFMVAICDALEACLLGNSLYPQDLPMAVIKHFVEQYDKYESVALSLLGEHSSAEESQQYAALLERQQELHGPAAEV